MGRGIQLEQGRCFGVNTDLAGLGFGIADVSEDYTVRKDVRREYEISPFNLGTIVHDINVRSGLIRVRRSKYRSLRSL